MFFKLNLKRFKKSAKNLSEFLESKGYDIPYPIILEGISKVFFFKNYNTAKAIISNPINQEFENMNKKVIFIDADINKDEILYILKDTASKANFTLKIDNFMKSGNKYCIYLDTLKTSHNFLTFMLELAPLLEKYNVKEFNFWMINQNKEDLMPYISNLNNLQNSK